MANFLNVTVLMYSNTRFSNELVLQKNLFYKLGKIPTCGKTDFDWQHCKGDVFTFEIK